MHQDSLTLPRDTLKPNKTTQNLVLVPDTASVVSKPAGTEEQELWLGYENTLENADANSVEISYLC